MSEAAEVGLLPALIRLTSITSATVWLFASLALGMRWVNAYTDWRATRESAFPAQFMVPYILGSPLLAVIIVANQIAQFTTALNWRTSLLPVAACLHAAAAVMLLRSDTSTLARIERDMYGSNDSTDSDGT